MCCLLPTLTSFLVLSLSRKMVRTENIGMVLLEDKCDTDSMAVTRYANTQLTLKTNVSLTSFCDKEAVLLEQLFSDTTGDVFIGALEHEYNALIMKYAELSQQPLISPFGTPRHVIHKQELIFSFGSSFESTASALRTALDHFRWKYIYLLVEVEESRINLATSIFVELTHNGFEPRIIYLTNISSDEALREQLLEIRSSFKGIVILTNQHLRHRILQTAYQGQFYAKHAFIIAETNPYISASLLDYNGLISANMPAILDSIFIFVPTFTETGNHTVKKRSVDNTNVYEENFRHRRDTFSNLLSETSFIYDAIMFVDEINSDNKSGDLKDAFHLVSDRNFNLFSGAISVDSDNRVLFDFVLYDIAADTAGVTKVLQISKTPEGQWQSDKIADIQWPGGHVLGPDECFHDDACNQAPRGLDALYILAIAIAVLFVAAVATAVIITAWRKIVRRDMSKGQQKVLLTNDDLVFLRKRDVQKGSKLINGTGIDRPDLIRQSDKQPSSRSMASLHEYEDITDTARYNGDMVHVKELKVKTFEMKNKVLHVIKTLRDVRQENVNAFIGFYDDPTSPALISDYCSRGSLEDVLNNSDIKLDWDFKVSLLTDLIRGVRYVHNSSLRWHGNLKCRNCLIDSRWVLKVADFGLANLFSAAKLVPEFEDKDLLFVAPEHLRHPAPPLCGSEKGDVYSIAIIMQCVVLRSDPYSTAGLSPHEIIHKLRHPPPLLRPSVSHGTAPPQYIQLMKVCWTENSEMRPSMEEIYQQFKLFTGGKKTNIVDTMFRMLEKYSTDLEELVKDRTLQLEEEKKKTDLLLYRMLPPVVADSLKVGRSIEAEQFSEVTIYFSDIVGFTTISANSTPMQVVDLLNDLYTMFDATIDAYDVYKVETIGDAYMVCSGVPARNAHRHAGEISTMALDLLSQCGDFTIKHMPQVPLRVRIGVHSGPCVAGVVGLTMPRYCLFGDTVNTASRLESTGAAYRIHISQAVWLILETLGGYRVKYRGEVELKGKGMAKTYWLIGKDGFNRPLPQPPPLASLSLDAFKPKPLKRTQTLEQFKMCHNDSNSSLNYDTPLPDTGDTSENSKVFNILPKKLSLDSSKQCNTPTSGMGTPMYTEKGTGFTGSQADVKSFRAGASGDSGIGSREDTDNVIDGKLNVIASGVEVSNEKKDSLIENMSDAKSNADSYTNGAMDNTKIKGPVKSHNVISATESRFPRETRPLSPVIHIQNGPCLSKTLPRKERSPGAKKSELVRSQSVKCDTEYDREIGPKPEEEFLSLFDKKAHLNPKLPRKLSQKEIRPTASRQSSRDGLSLSASRGAAMSRTPKSLECMRARPKLKSDGTSDDSSTEIDVSVWKNTSTDKRHDLNDLHFIPGMMSPNISLGECDVTGYKRMRQQRAKSKSPHRHGRDRSAMTSLPDPNEANVKDKSPHERTRHHHHHHHHHHHRQSTSPHRKQKSHAHNHDVLHAKSESDISKTKSRQQNESRKSLPHIDKAKCVHNVSECKQCNSVTVTGTDISHKRDSVTFQESLV